MKPTPGGCGILVLCDDPLAIHARACRRTAVLQEEVDMATSQETVDFLLDQLRALPGVRARKMFGEYALYVEDNEPARKNGHPR